jgi:hypothetical protein
MSRRIAMKNIRHPKWIESLARGTIRSLLGVLIFCGLGVDVCWGQQDKDEQDGINEGNYNVKQSIDFGYRFTSINGSIPTYDTMVNLRDGPRLLDFSVEMRSLDHHGTFFDRLYMNNFGYGGDPDVVTTIRMSKNKWYSFEGSYRKYQNFWDYSLLANPFNPSAPIANAPANFNPVANAPSSVVGTPVVAITPHLYNLRRNMQNYAVTFLPDSKVRFRFGYYFNASDGQTNSTIHQGTEQFLFEDYYAGLSQFRFGADIRVLPKTNISYDEILSYYKYDPGLTDVNQQFSLGPGIPPVDLGVSWNGPPCNPAFQPTGLVSTNCNAYFNYNSGRRTRYNFPTEQISLQSSWIPGVQFSGKFSYTTGDMNVNNYSQSFAGLETRSNTVDFLQTGPMNGKHVTSYADFGLTWKISPIFSFVDQFHYGNWQEPAQFTATSCSFFSTTLTLAPNIFPITATPPATCLPPANGVAGIPTHKSNSAADVFINFDSNFLKQQITSNLIEAQVQITPIAGAYLGYRYTHRVIADNFFNTQNALYFPNTAERGNCTAPLPAGCTLNADGSVSFQTPSPSLGPPGTTDITYNAAVMGLWFRPSPKLKVNLDADVGGADNFFTRVSPLQAQQFRIRVQYKPSAWLNLTGYYQTTQGQNPTITVNGEQHDRNAGVNISLSPSEKFSAQLGYNYNNLHSEIFICFTSDFHSPALLPCPGSPGLSQQFAVYNSNLNTGFIDFHWTPTSRLVLDLGANISTASGSELNLNPLAPAPTIPTGALNSGWYEPYGSVSYHFARNWTGRALWNYYGYHEDSNGSVQDLFVPRNFQGNTVTLSVRYAF